MQSPNRVSSFQSRFGATANTPQTDQIRSAIVEQQRELADIADYRLRSLEDQVRAKESEVKRVQEKFAKLKEDFQYNLKIIEDRDEEVVLYYDICAPHHFSSFPILSQGFPG
jgi:flagellar motility protein MotE (MotC chaperone)